MGRRWQIAPPVLLLMAIPKDRKAPKKISPKDRAEWGGAESAWRIKRRAAAKKRKQKESQ